MCQVRVPPVRDALAPVILQMFPSIYSTVSQASDALGKLSKQGPVEMDNFSQRITSGMVRLCTAAKSFAFCWHCNDAARLVVLPCPPL